MQNQATRNTISTSPLEIVDRTHNRPQVEMDIENHIRHIRNLISKLHPQDRQKYFNGFLTHLLHHRSDYPVTMKAVKEGADDQTDLSALSGEELSMIRELSFKLEEIYRISGDTEE